MLSPPYVDFCNPVMGGACGTNGGQERCIQGFGGAT
jgi:hypothetical protein